MTTLSPDIQSALEGQGIELPSWAFGNSGTRFRVFTTPGTGFRNDSLKFAEVNAEYANEFGTFSPTKIFSPIGSNVMDVQFQVAGQPTPAQVTGFGAVFSDVDVADATKIEFFDASGTRILVIAAPARSDAGGLSFVGVSYNSGERIGSVRIVSGNRSPDTGVIDGAGIDVVVLDDFVYGEPRAAEFHSGDADGDGVADPRIFRPGSATWYSLNSGSGAVSINGFGANGDIPIDGDFDGDSRADLCVFRPSNGSWWFLRSATGTVFVTVFGQNGDQPVAADYDKDGRTDIAFWRPSNGNYYILRSSTDFTSYYAFPFGQAGDIPVK